MYKVSKIPEKQTAAIQMKKTNSTIIARNALSEEVKNIQRKKCNLLQNNNIARYCVEC